MTEAWFLFDEAAIRRAAGNPNGRAPRNLPALRRVEALPDPKAILHNCLKEASEKTGRRLKDFRPAQAVQRLGQILQDFSPLSELPAFKEFRDRLEAEVRKVPDPDGAAQPRAIGSPSTFSKSSGE
jgi:hypothetical protein